MTLVENCLDSSKVKEFEIDEPLDEELMNRLAGDAQLKFYPHFPRPYFRIERQRYYVIQGVLGNRVFRVTLSPSAPEGVESELRQKVEG